MLGVFMKRWKPKRSGTNDRTDNHDDSSLSPEPPDRSPPKNRQIIHQADEKTYFDYDATFRHRKNAALDNENNVNYQTLSPVYPFAPNITVEGGKIEFVRTPPESARNSVLSTPPASPAVSNRTMFSHKRNRFNHAAAAMLYEEVAEKFDSDKEMLERRVKQLEYLLEEEKRKTQKERLSVAKLQNKLAKREGQARSDAERERKARGDTEARARAAESEAVRVSNKLHAAQREIARMEETVHNLLQYKTTVESLKQEKSSLAATIEAKNAHYQSQLSRLQAENENLRGQLLALSTGLEGDCCLDNVAHQVIATLISQKGLREELGCMRSRVRELESQNAALSALLVRQLRPHPRPSPASPPSPEKCSALAIEKGFSCRSSPGSLPPPECALEHRTLSTSSLISFKEDSPPPSLNTPGLSQLSNIDKRRHRILTTLWSELRGMEVTPAALARALGAVDPAHLMPPARPHSLHLPEAATVPLYFEGQNEEEQAAGSPESGNKDEGYSTMSSDVQADSSRQSEHNRELEDLKEASDETDNQTIVSVALHDQKAPASHTLTPDRCSIARYSFPPATISLPFKSASRSFSDSHLYVSFTPYIETRFSVFSSAPSSGGVIVLEYAGTGNGEGSLAGLDPSQYDAEYVQQWLELDDARSALQQRHRDIFDLEYDRAEVEDWSLSISCDDLRDEWRKKDPTTPGQVSLSTLPSIKEDDIIEQRHVGVDCVWSDGNWTCEVSPAQSASVSPSPPASWSSGGAGSDLPEDGRQSAPPGDEMSNSGIGIDFTRDFYRLVKYESSKSLASDISQPPPDREKALKNVLDFISEQRKYCSDKEEYDLNPSRPVSEVIIGSDINNFNLDKAKNTCDDSPIEFTLIENEVDQRYLKRIIENNDANKYTKSYQQIFNATSLKNEVCSIQESQSVDQNNSASYNEYSKQIIPTIVSPSSRQPLDGSTPIKKCIDSPIPLRRSANPSDRSSISKRNGVALEASMIDEMLGPCKRNSTLHTLPEEEECRHSEEKQTAPLSSSPEKEKNTRRSKIPMAAGGKRPQKKNISRIPVSKAVAQKEASVVKSTSLPFLENASSKDVINELSRMIRLNEDLNPSNGEEQTNNSKALKGDDELWCPTGWVRLEKDTDYNDPQARASLLDVMVASSDSSPSPTEADEEGAQYSKLHHLHRNRRQKKAAALRERGMAVLRATCCRRPSILDRSDLFVRYGEREREAVASFDFLEDLSSSASSPDNDGEHCSSQSTKAKPDCKPAPKLCDPT